MFCTPSNRFIGILFCSSLFFSSCRQHDDEAQDIVLSVYDEVLTLQELRDVVGPLQGEDSSAKANTFIEHWIEEQVLVNHAASQLDDQQKDVEMRLKQFRNDLLIYTFQQHMLNQHIDTSIAHAEVEAYFKANADNFVLNNAIVQARLVVLDKAYPKPAEVTKWIKSTKDEELVQLKQFCETSGSRHLLNDSMWIDFHELLKEIPLVVQHVEQYVRTQKNVRVEDEKKIYLLNIRNYKLAGTNSPLSFEEETIKGIILNKRKQEFLDKMRIDLLDQAKSNGAIQYAK